MLAFPKCSHAVISVQWKATQFVIVYTVIHSYTYSPKHTQIHHWYNVRFVLVYVLELRNGNGTTSWPPTM